MNKENMFAFLESIRESGKINMFGAAPYLEEAFDLNRYEARDILLEWMKTYREKDEV